MLISCGCGLLWIAPAQIELKRRQEANWRAWQVENLSFVTIKQSAIDRGFLYSK